MVGGRDASGREGLADGGTLPHAAASPSATASATLARRCLKLRVTDHPACRGDKGHSIRRRHLPHWVVRRPVPCSTRSPPAGPGAAWGAVRARAMATEASAVRKKLRPPPSFGGGVFGDVGSTAGRAVRRPCNRSARGRTVGRTLASARRAASRVGAHPVREEQGCDNLASRDPQRPDDVRTRPPGCRRPRPVHRVQPRPRAARPHRRPVSRPGAPTRAAKARSPSPPGTPPPGSRQGRGSNPPPPRSRCAR